jgi:hypothetical protein
LIDVNQYGNAHLYQLWKIPASAVDGWGTTGTEPTGTSSTFFSGYYKQFTWDGKENIIRDWRARYNWKSVIPYVGESPPVTTTGPYNDQLAFTVESGWKYMIVRMVSRLYDDFCDTPLMINVNDPYYNPDLSYVPPVVTIASSQPVANRKSLPLSKQVGSYTPTSQTTASTSFDYELGTGFNYDEISNKISVFDGNYNNLTSKPTILNGKGWTDASYNSTTGILTFNSTDALGFTTSDLRGGAGANGKGWTGATYAAGTGIVTFASTDALGFSTGDLRGGAGANGKGWTGATYAAGTGMVTFASNDAGYALTTGDLRGGAGTNGKGWTGASYNATTGKVSFTSTDGTPFVFDTGDLRGASGATTTSTQLAGLLNTTQFINNTVTNKQPNITRLYTFLIMVPP